MLGYRSRGYTTLEPGNKLQHPLQISSESDENCTSHPARQLARGEPTSIGSSDAILFSAKKIKTFLRVLQYMYNECFFIDLCFSLSFSKKNLKGSYLFLALKRCTTPESQREEEEEKKLAGVENLFDLKSRPAYTRSRRGVASDPALSLEG